MVEDQFKKLESHVLSAWTAGAISAVFTFIAILFSIFNNKFKVSSGINSWMFIDLAIIIVLTYGIYRKNRFCALGMLIYFTINTISRAITQKSSYIGIVSIIFIIFFIQGTIATFIIHKSIQNNSNHKNKKKVFVKIVSGFTFAIIIVFFTLSSLGPSTEVISGEKLNKKYYNFIYDNKLIDPSEKIICWYSDAFYNFKNRFYFFTDKHIVIYIKKHKRPDMSIPFSEISFLDIQKEKTFFKDSKIKITLKNNSVLNIPVSNDNNGDEMFFNKLKSIWKKQLWENQLHLQPKKINDNIFFKTMNQMWKTNIDNNLNGK